MRWVLTVIVLGGCGRIAFDPRSGDGGAGGDDGAMSDAPPLGARVAYLKAANTDPGDEFGASLAISRDGSTIAVGAPLESSAARTINGNAADNSALEQGAVYVFRRTGATWAQEAYIKAANGDAGDQFGWAVALSGTGDTLVVGARHEDAIAYTAPNDNTATNSGAVYVFARVGSSWTQDGYIKPNVVGSTDTFGERVAISDDGSTIAAGAPLEDSGVNTINGNALDDTAMDAGAAYVFTKVASSWNQEAYIKANNTDAGDEFGGRVSLSTTGDVLAVGAFGEDSNATGVGGNVADDSLTNSGAVYMYTRSTGTWQAPTYFKASNTNLGDDFGYALLLTPDAATLLVAAEGEASGTGNQADNSAPSSGALYVFRAGPWAQAAYLKATNIGANDELGYGLGTNSAGTLIVIGAPFEDGDARGIDGDGTNNAATDSGAAYLFSTTGAFAPRYIKSPNTTAGDQLGWTAAMSGAGDIIAIGAPFEDGSATGVDRPVDEAAADSGAVWVYY